MLTDRPANLPVIGVAASILAPCIQEILTKAHANESPKEMARIATLLSIEEAALFDAGRASVDALNRWRFGGRAVPTRPSAKRRLDGAPANGTR